MKPLEVGDTGDGGNEVIEPALITEAQVAEKPNEKYGFNTAKASLQSLRKEVETEKLV